MDRFKRYRKAVSNIISTQWLVECALDPSDNMRQVEVDLILLEITRRIWNGETPVPSNSLL